MTTEEVARDSRKTVLGLVHKAQTSHIGSLFSCADIFAAVFDKIDLDTDRFVLSAGWKAAMLYYHLWRKGEITREELDSYCQPGSEFIGLAEPLTRNGKQLISIAGGSMGLGLPGAVGLAMAKKLKKEPGTVYCLMSDGEMAIGTTWESALIAAHHGLDNLVVLFDCNGFQAMGETDDILSLGNPSEKWSAFGWAAGEVHGHNLDALAESLAHKHDGLPSVILAATVKGKGVSFMEENNEFHYRATTENEYSQAILELCI